MVILSEEEEYKRLAGDLTLVAILGQKGKQNDAPEVLFINVALDADIRAHVTSAGFVPILVSLLSEDEAGVVDDALGITEVLARLCHEARAITEAGASLSTSSLSLSLSTFINRFDKTEKCLSAPRNVDLMGQQDLDYYRCWCLGSHSRWVLNRDNQTAILALVGLDSPKAVPPSHSKLVSLLSEKAGVGSGAWPSLVNLARGCCG